jgi:hypothetical protein
VVFLKKEKAMGEKKNHIICRNIALAPSKFRCQFPLVFFGFYRGDGGSKTRQKNVLQNKNSRVKKFLQKNRNKQLKMVFVDSFTTFLGFSKGPPKKKGKKGGELVGCFCVGLRCFGLFCKNLLHVILTPPARYQHPHDANNPQVGHWSLGQL